MAAPLVDHQVLSPVSVSSSEEKNQIAVKDGRSYQVESSRHSSSILEIALMVLGLLGFVVGSMLLTVASGGAAPVGVLYAGIISVSVAAVCGTPFFIETIFSCKLF